MDNRNKGNPGNRNNNKNKGENKTTTTANTTIVVKFDEEMLERAIVNALKKAEDENEKDTRIRGGVLGVLNMIFLALIGCAFLAVGMTAITYTAWPLFNRIICAAFCFVAGVALIWATFEASKDKYREALAFSEVIIALIALVVSLVALIK